MLRYGNWTQFSNHHRFLVTFLIPGVIVEAPSWYRASAAAVSEFGLACVGKGLVLQKNMKTWYEGKHIEGEPWSRGCLFDIRHMWTWPVGALFPLQFLANIQLRFFRNVSGYSCSTVLRSIADWVLLLAFCLSSSKSLVGGLEHFLFFHILGIIIPTD